MRSAVKKNQLAVLTVALALTLTACAAPGQAEGSAPVTDGEEPLVTDRYHLEYDSPDNYRLDITLPLFREDLPGAEEINSQIAEDFALFLDMEPEDFASVEWGFDYPMVHIHYEQFVFEDLVELVARYEAHSLYGSGPAAFHSVYCYDKEKKSPVALSRLMEQLEISEEDVVDAYMEMYGIGEEERGMISFERDLVRFFFLGEEGTIQIEYNQ